MIRQRRRFFSLTIVGWLGLVVLLPVVVSGCSVGSGKVSGQVLQANGKPLAGGIVMFRPTDTSINPVTAKIDENGNYEASVPSVQVKISVDNRSLKNPGSGPVGASDSNPAELIKGRNAPPKGAAIGPPKDAMSQARKDQTVPPAVVREKPVGTYVDIPEKYYDPETSGLTLQVTGGNQKFDINLSK
jgi:hypothetical protein